jgi:AcrR family transcriptional regulator
LGLKERQEREREAVARAILDAARDLFLCHGYHNVSIRKIAERIEYSPAAIYSYFPSKDDIFFALAAEGFRLLASTATEPPAAHDPLDEIRSMFWHYYAFSKSHPEYFALMFLDRTVPRITRDWRGFEFVAALKQQLHERIERAVDGGAFPAGTSPHAVFRILLTALHGAATLRVCDRMERGEDADLLARATLDAAIQGLRAGSGVNCQLSECVETGSAATAGRR